MQELKFNIDKVSVNEWNKMHWAKQGGIKKDYKVLVNQITKAKKFNGYFHVEYHFEFTNNPLDATNCYAMVKMLEDLLFHHDEYNKVLSMLITSRFSSTNRNNVRIVVQETDPI